MSERTIGEAIAGARDYLRGHPDEGRSRDPAATATIDSGLRCQVTGPRGASLVSDMTTGVGGRASAPSPGWLLRAAFAACDATVIAMRAAEEGIILSRLEVDVDSESDDRGLLGIDEAPAGPLSISVRIAIAADGVDEARLREIVDWARDHSPVDDAIRRAVPVKVEIDTTPLPS
jgi:uncharacterized OsmC-like protein